MMAFMAEASVPDPKLLRMDPDLYIEYKHFGSGSFPKLHVQIVKKVGSARLFEETNVFKCYRFAKNCVCFLNEIADVKKL